MAKKVYLSESQFKQYMRSVMKEAEGDNSRFLDVDEIDNLLHKMVDYEFMLYFPKYGKRYNCAYQHEKGEIFDAVCSGHPRINTKGLIELENQNYGIFYMDNLINAHL